jgi:sigma-E factor negative regulatory protein RseC
MDICQKGTIKEIKGNILFVEIERKTACAACHAKSVCIPFVKKDEVIPIPIKQPEIFCVGEIVQLSLKQSLGMRAVIIAYLFPFVVLSLGLFLIYYITKNELLSVGVAFMVTSLYYLLLKKIDNKLKKHFTFSVSKTNK